MNITGGRTIKEEKNSMGSKNFKIFKQDFDPYKNNENIQN